MKKNIALLGSTGSIGRQTLDVARELGLSVRALAANRDIIKLESQIREFHPAIAAVFDADAARSLKIAVSDTGTRIVSGMEGLIEAACEESAEVLLNAVVGMVGLQPTLHAIEAKKQIALANKETLVAGGALVKKALRKNGVALYPVDSEHSAIFQCLEGCHDRADLKRIILTASGGPFFGRTRGELCNMKAADALRHPTWNMGHKITIDSATLMNKGLEVMEAGWLFDLPEERIGVVVHRESIIHSMIEYKDNAVIAQLGTPDMRIPIQYALTYPRRYPSKAAPLDLASIGKMTFFEIDPETFLCYKACREAMRRGGLYPAAVNGANEAAVALFLQDRISFNQIGDLVYETVSSDYSGDVTLENILAADRNARDFVESRV
ncbi:MAG: 1-deoxy-D-xylulose-5-phosphate reductoisomerase [Clostridia bacterium]|nr:1-deoxy-D-xylulose-5-phosphate reductoisomerase [Clostridia bacterium]